MSEISDIMWNTMQSHYRIIVNNICNEYENNPKYTLKKIYEHENLVGFFCYYDTDTYRMLEAGYYIGNNPFTALRMYRWMKKGVKTLRAFIQKSNQKVLDTYLHIGFKVIDKDLNNYLLEWRA